MPLHKGSLVNSNISLQEARVCMRARQPFQMRTHDLHGDWQNATQSLYCVSALFPWRVAYTVLVYSIETRSWWAATQQSLTERGNGWPPHVGYAYASVPIDMWVSLYRMNLLLDSKSVSEYTRRIIMESNDENT